MHHITYRHYITLLEHIYYINKHQFEIIHESKKEKKKRKKEISLTEVFRVRMI